MAQNINRVTLTANLTRDPELRPLPSGSSVCKLRVAVNSRVKDGASGQWRDKPNYFDVTVFGSQADACARFLAKGRPVAIDGRLDWHEWETQEGQKRQAVEIIAETVQFLGDGGGSREGAVPVGGHAASDGSAFTPGGSAASRVVGANVGIADDDIPFVWDGPPSYMQRYASNR